MKILLVEDEEDKSIAVAARLTELLGAALRLKSCQSLRGGLHAICEDGSYDLVLLDMSMPGFEPSEDEPGVVEEPESFAGEEILAQMKLRELSTPVVVITQYKAFASGTIGLEELVEKYQKEYPDFFRGAIYYSTAVDSWKKELGEVIAKVQNAGSTR